MHENKQNCIPPPRFCYCVYHLSVANDGPQSLHAKWTHSIPLPCVDGQSKRIILSHLFVELKKGDLRMRATTPVKLIKLAYIHKELLLAAMHTQHTNKHIVDACMSAGPLYVLLPRASQPTYYVPRP
jgi:hypothetical protein